jgi:glycosyltransferase involved in cell wall biosynthesis
MEILPETETKAFSGISRADEAQFSRRQRMSETNHVNRAALVGTYLPRQCGIATFTKDLRDAIAACDKGGDPLVIAMDEGNLNYPADVRFQIRAHQQGDYRVAAEMLNINQVDVSIVQHEFGIYGGADGALLLNFMRRLRTPIICTMHTVLKEPSKRQARIIREMGELSDKLVVMSHLGAEFLRDIYDIPAGKIAFIPHGIPDVPFVDPSFYKDQFALEGRTVLLTFGLLSPGKGIDVMLEALPGIVEKHPDVMYVVLGATHPNVLREQGDAYRTSLMQIVDKHGMRDHVVFQNRFVAIEELIGYIGAADIYVTPYRNEAQITSGTLAYAMGAGKAVVSTPYWYASEMLDEGRGRIVPFDDSEAFTHEVNTLIDDEVACSAMRKKAYTHCRRMIWNEVAREYLKTAVEAAEERRNTPRHVVVTPADVVTSDTIPEINLGHLRTMTDDTGIYQHAIYTIPDRHHGYCTDDNARALVTILRYYNLRRDESVLPLTATYLAFLHSAFNREKGRFRNFLSFDRRWLEEVGSEDSHARAVMSLGETVSLAPNGGVLGYATRLFNDALPVCETFPYPRSMAYTLIGIHTYLRRFGGDTHIRRTRALLAKKLFTLFEKRATDEWPWCEDVVTYGNARLSQALILSGQWLPDDKMLQQGLKSLEWLLDIQTNEEGGISLIGCDGWYTREGKRAIFDQQPIEIMALVEACAEAWRCTSDIKWLNEIRRCLDWFLGRNDIGGVLYDFKTGGSRDGLDPQGTNQNEGAESTLSWLISLMIVYELMGGQDSRDGEKIHDEATGE